MPIIRHRSGPLAGQEQTIEAGKTRIVFGRDPSACDVVYPPDATTISRRHFALVRKPSGDWVVEDFGQPFVAVNGHPADGSEAVASGALLELGRVGGPSFEFVSGARDLDNALPVTGVQQTVENTYASSKRVRTLAIGGGVAAVLAVGITAGVMMLSQRKGAELESAVAQLSKRQAEVAADTIGSDVRNRLLAAAHVVVVRTADGQERAMGTASPVAPDLLATNAHVAEAFVERKPGDRIFVRSPGANGRLIEVTEVTLHPGYSALQKFSNDDPIFVQSFMSANSILRAALGYDVATMRVAKDANLSPVLEVAGPAEIAALKPGQALALAGFPLEGILGREVQSLGATPNLRTGMINALTDFFHLPTGTEQQKLVHHNIGVTGGNSGSPVVNAQGKLVALLNSGNVIMRPDGQGRIPNAAIVNYAQRADMLADLIAGRADAAVEVDRKYWEKQTAAFKRGFDVIVPTVLEQSKPQGSGPATLVAQTKGTLAKSEAYTATDKGKEVKRRQVIHPVTLRAGTPSFLMAYAQERTAVQVYLVSNGQIVAQNAQGNWFPHLTYTAPTDMKAEVYVVGPDEDVNYTLVQYAWGVPRS
ncbi:MAG TPA: trypsin-like peptidase domain-containing protein [Salinarimonas sp.]|jgi:hypothetical protein|nr:trypsin-like peptidase domain-containing protein [Salinarimonas sp.]